MPHIPDFDHSLPNTPSNDDIKVFYDLVDSGGAFQNPAAPAILTMQQHLATIIPTVEILAGLVDPNGINNWSQSDLQDLETVLVELEQAIGAFEVHTDRVSGASFPGDVLNQNPNVLALLSATQSLNVVEGNIGEGFSDAQVLLFGSIVDYPSIISAWNDDLKDLNLKITQTAPYDPPFAQPMPLATTLMIEGWVSELDTKRATENSNYNTIVQKITLWALSQTLTTPDESWKDFLVNTMASPALAELLEE